MKYLSKSKLKLKSDNKVVSEQIYNTFLHLLMITFFGLICHFI